jgi:hypothetical protein
MAKPLGSGRSTFSSGAGSFLTGTNGDAPRISLAVWAKALVARTVVAATLASVLMSVVIAFLLWVSAARE